MIRLAKLEDIENLAYIYKELYDDVEIWESWSVESAKNLLSYWYNRQPDLFFVVEVDGKVVGGIVSGIKPWFDGNRLVDGELFVDSRYQEKYLGKELLKKHLFEAKRIYDAKIIEFHTYGDQTEFPQNWYKRIWCKKDKELIIMNWEIENILKYLEL